MTDRIRIICSNCRQTFSERANRLKPGYQVQCVHCSRLITFDSGSEDPNIRRPLRAAREFRLAAEEALGLAPHAALRLAALAVFVKEDAERLAARLRLSNNELAVLALGADDHAAAELPDESAAKRALYRLGPCSFEAHVLLASADAGIPLPDDQNWRRALRLADRWDVPEFPLRGPDIMALGEVKGLAIGEILRQIEAEWVAGGFAASREALLARAAELSRKSSKPGR